MSQQDRTTLKGFFEKGDIPTEQNFADLIDSALNKEDDSAQILPAPSSGDGGKISRIKDDESGWENIKLSKMPGGDSLLQRSINTGKAQFDPHIPTIHPTKDGVPACITFIWDGSSDEVWDDAGRGANGFPGLRDIFNSRNIPFNISLSPPDPKEPDKDDLGARLSDSQILTLQDEGHEMMTHMRARDRLDIGFDDALDWVKYSYEFHTERDLDVRHCNWFGGAHNIAWRSAVREYYRSAWDTAQGVNERPCMQFRLHRTTLDHNGTTGNGNGGLNGWKQTVDDVIAKNGFVCFYGHPRKDEEWWDYKYDDDGNQDANGEYVWEKVEKLIDYILAKTGYGEDVEITTTDTAITRHGNAISFEDKDDSTIRAGISKYGEFGLVKGHHYQTTDKGTKLGWQAGLDSSGGDNTTYVGYRAGRNNIGSDVSAAGHLATEDNEGDNVVAFGGQSGRRNTGEDSSFLGYLSGLDNSGARVSGIGYQATRNNIGSDVVAVGLNSGFNNEGNDLTAIGQDAGKENTGNNNTFIGNAAGYQNPGDNCVGVGILSLFSNTGGLVTSVGSNSGRSNSGVRCVFAGWGAGRDNGGNDIIAVGYEAGRNNTAHKGIFIGRKAGYGNDVSDLVQIGDLANYSHSFIKGKLGTGEIVLGAPTSATPDAFMDNSRVSFWLDEPNDDLKFKVKYSDGTIKTGTVALA